MTALEYLNHRDDPSHPYDLNAQSLPIYKGLSETCFGSFRLKNLIKRVENRLSTRQDSFFDDKTSTTLKKRNFTTAFLISAICQTQDLI